MKKRLLLGLRLGASATVLCLLMRSVDVDTVLRPIQRDGWLYLALCAVIFNMDRFLMSYKWSILLKARSIPFSFPSLVKSYYVGTVFGSLLPATVGGDIVRACRISLQGSATQDIVSSIILERVLGAVASLAMGAGCLILAVVVTGVFPWWVAVLTMLGMVAAIFLGWCLIRQPGRSSPGAHPQPAGKPRHQWVERVVGIYDACREYRHHPGALLRFTAWTLLEQCIPVVCVFFTALALNIPVSFLNVATFTPLVMIVAKLPLTFDGFGIREWLYVYLLARVGVSSSESFTLGLVSHVIGSVALLPGFLISIL